MAIDFYFNYTKSLNSWKYVNNFLFLWSFFAYTKVLNPGEIVRRFSHQKKKKKEKHNSLTHAGCTIRLLFFFRWLYICFFFSIFLRVSEMRRCNATQSGVYVMPHKPFGDDAFTLAACSVDCRFRRCIVNFCRCDRISKCQHQHLQ